MSRSVAVMPMTINGQTEQQQQQQCFQMPVHYPRYSKVDYEAMPEWKLDCLLTQYGLPATGDLHHKRGLAIGAFLWPAAP